MTHRMTSAPVSVIAPPAQQVAYGLPAHSSMVAPAASVLASPMGMLGPAVHAVPLHSAPAAPFPLLSAAPAVAQPTCAMLSPGPRTTVYEVPVDVNLDGLHDELKVRMSLIAGLEQQNTELKNVLADAKESLSLSLAERERLNARVLELEREIRRVQAELASLQRKYDEILDSNAKQEARIAELEAEVLQLGGELPTSKAHILGDDFMDLKVQEWLDAHPDFEIAIEKVAPSSYRVGRPIDKVVSMKISGKNVLVRAGGGYIEVSRWLDEIYHEHQEGQQIRQSLSRSSKKRGSRSGSK